MPAISLGEDFAVARLRGWRGAILTGMGLSPTSVAVTPSGRFVYIANGTSNDITIYTIDQTTGALTLPQMVTIPSTPPDAPLPVSIAVDPSARYAYVTNSGTNDISAFAIDPNTGALSQLIGSPISQAGGPSFVAVEPSGRFAHVANLLASTISVFDIDTNTGLLSPKGDTLLPANSGPRSLAVDPSGKFVYVTLSSSNQVAAFRIDAATVGLTAVNGSPFETGSNPLGVIATGPIQ